MKIIKEQLHGKEERRSGWFQREKSVESTYDGTIKLLVTKEEYQYILNASQFTGKGYKIFCKEAIEQHEYMTTLIQPTSEDAPKEWLSFQFEERDKETLIKAAKKAGLNLEEFTRALVFTAAKETMRIKAECDARRTEQLRRQTYKRVTITLSDEQVQQFEQRFGMIQGQDVEVKLMELLSRELA